MSRPHDNCDPSQFWIPGRPPLCPSPCMAATAASTMIAFMDLARQAGAGPTLVNYLTAKGLGPHGEPRFDRRQRRRLGPPGRGALHDGMHHKRRISHPAQPEHHAAVRAIIAHMSCGRREGSGTSPWRRPRRHRRRPPRQQRR